MLAILDNLVHRRVKLTVAVGFMDGTQIEEERTGRRGYR